MRQSTKSERDITSEKDRVSEKDIGQEEYITSEKDRVSEKDIGQEEYITSEKDRVSEKDIRSERDKKNNRYVQDIKSENVKKGNKPGQDIKEIVKGFVGRNIIVVTRGKKSLSGKLESVSNYELLLTVNHEPVIVMKHAVDYISLTATSL
jgi:hypothetical protein